VHSWNIFGVMTSHGQTQTHKTHHGLDLGESITFPLIVYSMVGHRTSIQMAFVSGLPSGSPKISHLGFLQLSGPITLRVDLWLGWGFKKSCSLHWELSNGISHATYTQGNQSDSWLLVVESQTANLIPNLSFGHNLCFGCRNGSCKPILDIYVPKAF
jgi:hypothetical protein